MYEYAYARPSRVTSGTAIVWTPAVSGGTSLRTSSDRPVRRSSFRIVIGTSVSVAMYRDSPSALHWSGLARFVHPTTGLGAAVPSTGWSVRLRSGPVTASQPASGEDVQQEPPSGPIGRAVPPSRSRT